MTGFQGAGDEKKRYAKRVAMFRAPELLDENDLKTTSTGARGENLL
ncbi:hypothetical protein K0C01_02850 [Salinarchaeum sp. IM2453]|nr:hypothetical protein [Salinarchaeum sp. IM2453]QZA89109.1 hypothetical protein K0C01_02850 [Salinarchaeum sp. IM2453]